MKRAHSIAIILGIAALAGCMKTDVKNGVGILEQCSVAHYNGILYDGLSFGNETDIAYNESGLIKSVHTFIAANFQFVDEVDYAITWTKINNQLVATIQAKKQFWEALFDGSNALQRRTDKDSETYLIKAWFDSKGLVKIEGPSDPIFPFSFVMTYSPNGRLLKFGKFELEYDSKGNVTRVPKIDGSGHGAMIYSHDLNKTIKNQFYITSGYNVTECYNLAELCGWIPVQPKNIRTGVTFSWGQDSQGDYIAGRHVYTNHATQGNFLKSYSVANSGTASTAVLNVWNCNTLANH